MPLDAPPLPRRRTRPPLARCRPRPSIPSLAVSRAWHPIPGGCGAKVRYTERSMSANSQRRPAVRPPPPADVSFPTSDGSFALRGRLRDYHWRGEGMLSIKSFAGGSALYEAGGGLHAVDDDSYLILNHGRAYSVTVESETPVESFCVFFSTALAADVRANALLPQARLLDQPDSAVGTAGFYERCYPHDAILTPSLHALRAALRPGTPEQGLLVEGLHALLMRLLLAHGQVEREVQTLHAVRAATRAELYRRVHLARDHAAATLDRPVPLDELARVAGLSPNHLLRAFHQVLGQTPHQHLTTLRLERARTLLATTTLPVTEICLAVGFQSLGSFSGLFSRRVGVSPQAYRRQMR